MQSVFLYIFSPEVQNHTREIASDKTWRQGSSLWQSVLDIVIMNGLVADSASLLWRC